LKKYISEGRRIVREIETETFEENPPLFREYISAPAEIKVLMDNQFKNVKTHARLLSKAMWYEWRMKLQDGLKEGLVKIADDMTNDAQMLDTQEELLQSIVPKLVERLEQLEDVHGNLVASAEELAGCNPEELQEARADLVAAEQEIEEKAARIAELRRQLAESEAGVESLSSQKQRCLEDIRDAEKIREECRGWTATEIGTLKGKKAPQDSQRRFPVVGIARTKG
jgi:kinetochore protein Spc7/SPC105